MVVRGAPPDGEWWPEDQYDYLHGHTAIVRDGLRTTRRPRRVGFLTAKSTPRTKRKRKGTR